MPSQSTRETANLTKHALNDELEQIKTSHQQELQQVSEGRVAQVEAAKKEHEQELLKLLQEKKDLLEMVESEREAKDRGSSLFPSVQSLSRVLTFLSLFSVCSSFPSRQHHPNSSYVSSRIGSVQRVTNAEAPRGSQQEVS